MARMSEPSRHTCYTCNWLHGAYAAIKLIF